MPRISRQTIAPCPFTTQALAENDYRALVVKMSNPATVLRYLTSKVVFTDKEISKVEIVTLFAAFDEVIQLMEGDRAYSQKYGSDVFTFRSVFQELDFLSDMCPKERHQKLSKKFDFYRGKIFSRRFYFSVEGQAKKQYETLIIQRFPKRFPPKAYIGKGYGDHGTAKNKAFDASPSWQEVSVSEETRSQVTRDRNVDYYRSFIVHKSQLERTD